MAYKIITISKKWRIWEKTIECFPLGTDLPLKAIKSVFEASSINKDQVSTTEMLIIFVNYIRKIFQKSPFCILKDIDINDNNDEIDNILKKAWGIADHDKDDCILWYLLITWFLDCFVA